MKNYMPRRVWMNGGGKQPTCGLADLPEQYRACQPRISRACSPLQRKRTGGSQHVTVKHIHQQVNVTEGGQAVVAGDTVASRARGRRSAGGGMVENER